MKNYKNFKEYTDENHVASKFAVLLLKSECGMDWYTAQTTFSKNTLKVVYDDNGNIADSNIDVTTLFPYNCSVLEVSKQDLPKEFKNSEWIVSDSKLVKRTTSTEKLKADFETEKTKRIETAQQVLQFIELTKKHNVGKVSAELAAEWELYFITVMTLTYRKGVEFPVEPQKP